MLLAPSLCALGIGRFAEGIWRSTATYTKV